MLQGFRIKHIKRIKRIKLVSGLLAGLAVGSIIAVPSATAADAANAQKIIIMVGGINKLIYLPPKLAENLGYFKEAGLDVELQSQQAGVDAENELLAGAVQAVVGYYDHSIDLQSKGKEVQSIVQLLLVPGGMLMVRADMADKIKTMADAKGHTVGVTGFGSSSSFLTQYLAARNGLKTSDYSMLPVGAGNTLIAAFKQKRIEIAWTTEPTTSMLTASGDAKPLVDLNSVAGTRASLGGLYPASSLYVQTAWLQSHKTEAAKLAGAFVKTLKYIQTHSAEEIADKMPADYYGGNKAMYVQALKSSLPMYSPDGRMPADGAETVLKVMSGFNPNIKGKRIDLSRTYTNDYVK